MKTDESQRRSLFSGVVIGKLCDLSARGEARVDFPGNPEPDPLPAPTLVRLEPSAVGREIALSFEGGDPRRPLVLGVIQRPEPAAATRMATLGGGALEATLDDERIVLDARKEIVLRCGSASITLTRDGKIRIRGRDLLTRSSGGNRIKGASVQIN